MGMHSEVANLYMEQKRKKMLKNFTFLKAFDLNLFTHYSIFIALFFSIFSSLCSHQPPMVVHQGHKKSSFFLPKFMALVSRKISLFTLFFGISKKKIQCCQEEENKRFDVNIMEETGVILYFK